MVRWGDGCPDIRPTTKRTRPLGGDGQERKSQYGRIYSGDHMEKNQAIGIMLVLLIIGIIILAAVVMVNWAQGTPLFDATRATDPVKSLISSAKMSGKPWAAKVEQVGGHMDEISDTGFSLLHGGDAVLIHGTPEEPVKYRRIDSSNVKTYAGPLQWWEIGSGAKSDTTETLKSTKRIENTETSDNCDIRVDFQ